MPHNVPEEKEWLHLRDAICLGDVDAIVDQLLMEGIAVEYGEMEAELISMKTNLGWDSCAVVDKETFKESINKLISESVAIPQPQDAPEFKTYKESVDSRRWDRIFDDMIGRASGRKAPSHYTDDEQIAHEAGHHGDAPQPRQRSGLRIPDLPAGPVPPSLAMPEFPVDLTFLDTREKRRLGVQYLKDNPSVRRSVVAKMFGVSYRTVINWEKQAELSPREDPPSAHEPGQESWREAAETAREWAVNNLHHAEAGYAVTYLDALLDGTVERRGEQYAAQGIPGTDREHMIQTHMPYILNNLTTWRGEEARNAKAIFRAVQKGDLPAHYTDETPEGALEAMERRLSGGFSEQMAEALAQMELKVGELAEAVRRMGASVPAPIVEAVEAVEDAVEVVEAGGRASSMVRARAIREYIVGLGARASEENTRSVVAALQGRFPGITERDVTNAIRPMSGGSPLGRSPLVRQPRQPSPTIRMPRRGKALIVANYLVGLGADAANTTMETFLAGINAANPGLSPPVEYHDYHATLRGYPDLPRISLAGRGVGGSEARRRLRAEGSTSLEDLMQSGYQRPERRYRGGPHSESKEDRIRNFTSRALGRAGRGMLDLADMTYEELFALLGNYTREEIEEVDYSTELAEPPSTLQELREAWTPQYLTEVGLPQLRGSSQ